MLKSIHLRQISVSLKLYILPKDNSRMRKIMTYSSMRKQSNNYSISFKEIKDQCIIIWKLNPEGKNKQ
jgi:hypothetical protein